jgi:NAD(P)-dependent dehydrogenase (short-subunit alcohol dehydrogenase family)
MEIQRLNIKMKKVLITAPNSPFGKYFIEFFGEKGDFLFLQYRGEHHHAVDDILRKYRGEGFAFEFKKDNLKDWFKEIEYIEPDILINNFGPIIYKSWKKQTPEEWERVLNFNIILPFFSAQKAIKIMEKTGYGRIINIGFHNLKKTEFYFPNVLPYAISKFGIKIINDTLRQEINGDITINMISPEYIEGSPFKPANSDKSFSKKRLFEILDTITGDNSPNGENFFI